MFIGTDIVEVERIERAVSVSGIAFLQRVFTEREINKIDAREPNYERAAGFWAAKESMVKAVGLGFREGIRFHDMEVEHDIYGCPCFVLHGRLKEILTERRMTKLSLSISHCRTHAIAVVAILTQH
ncbi:holo-ACP synthase [Mixta tenebrionis]|uniref:Holo-[acyl-carrier-protein] synthase n=1 Tax=Mixta tenebrionis TaxID=2562439 RepID=A0A506VFX9_9GAMM|nr:holo-ACP synthase [Mixta tenebrionis]TPW44498.1 holo-[acyl-carrier-protein] synthase [Mixta tenebrionis]